MWFQFRFHDKRQKRKKNRRKNKTWTNKSGKNTLKISVKCKFDEGKKMQKKKKDENKFKI